MLIPHFPLMLLHIESRSVKKTKTQAGYYCEAVTGNAVYNTLLIKQHREQIHQLLVISE